MRMAAGSASECGPMVRTISPASPESASWDKVGQSARRFVFICSSVIPKVRFGEFQTFSFSSHHYAATLVLQFKRPIETARFQTAKKLSQCCHKAPLGG